MIKAIIPAAGFGTRVGMKPGESKEMLIWDKEAPNRVIDYSLNLCKEAGLEPLVISRAEKEDLNTYLRGKGIEPVIIEPKGEWMDSILAVEEYWGWRNILMLPDTRYNNSLEIIKQMMFQILTNQGCLSLGLHYVDNGSKWCIWSEDRLIEKPKAGGDPGWAFGVVGFNKQYGKMILEELSETKMSIIAPETPQFLLIENFIDITRGDHVLFRDSND